MTPWVKYLLIIGAIQGFLFAFALSRIKSPKSRAANRVLISLLLIVTFFMAVSSQANLLNQISIKITLLSYALIFTYCPLYYLFTEALYLKQFSLKRKHLVLLLPATVFLLAWLRYAFMPNAQLLEILREHTYYDLLVADSTSVLLNFYFLWKTWSMASTHNKANDNMMPSRKAFLVPTIGLALANGSWLMMILSFLGYLVLSIALRPDILYLSMSFLILLFGYFLVLRMDLFSSHGIAKAGRYQSVNLDERDCYDIEAKILTALAKHSPYKNPDFTLGELATLTATDRVKLSYTINSHMGTNFSSLLSKYRVEEFIQLIESGRYENFNLLGIANEAGFSSKSTFYKAFKDLKGQTPKEYLRKLSVELSD